MMERARSVSASSKGTSGMLTYASIVFGSVSVDGDFVLMSGVFQDGAEYLEGFGPDELEKPWLLYR